jgi:hypothetical protein
MRWKRAQTRNETKGKITVEKCNKINAKQRHRKASGDSF